jgi:hypothetical protein
MVKIARSAFRKIGLDPARIILDDVCDLSGFDFQLVVMINTLSFNADFRKPIDRLVETGAKVLVIRDNFGPKTVVKWELDGFLDLGFNHLKGYWNQWSRQEVADFLHQVGYRTTFVDDLRTKGKTELVVNKPYRWSWLVADRP